MLVAEGGAEMLRSLHDNPESHDMVRVLTSTVLDLIRKEGATSTDIDPFAAGAGS